MTRTVMATLVRHLGKIVDPSGATSVGDAELLKRFVHHRDEAAFELLVWRHQRLVQGVCRRVLGDGPEVEDAFQATFLTLARKAASVAQGDAVASWLHVVAVRIALRARAAAQRTTTNVDLTAIEARADASGDPTRRDLAALLDEEINRLPRTYRVPVVLCYLEGKTYVEAGRQLGVPVGTLAGRLTRARELLRGRLQRRGIGASGAILAALLSEQASAAAVPAALVNSTVKTVASILLGAMASGDVSATVAALSEGALRSMVVSKLKIGTMAVLASLLVTGMALLIPATAGVQSEPPAKPPASVPAAAVDKDTSLHIDRFGDPLPDGALFRFGSMRMRHAGTIYNSALSPDGKLLATASGDSVLLWNLAEGRIVRRLHCEHSGTFSIPGLRFSPNGKYLAYVQDNFDAYVWNVETGKEIARFAEKNPRHVTALCQFTADNEELILSDGFKRIRFWNVQAHKESRSLPIEHVSLLSPDTRLCVRNEPKGVTFFDSRTGKEMGRLEVSAVSHGIAFAPNGESLAIVHQNKEIQVRRLPKGELRVSFPLPDTAKYRVSNMDYWDYRLFFSADGRTLLLGTKAGLVHRWDLASGKELPPLSKHIGAVAGVHVLPDGKTIITTGSDGLIRRWDSQTARQLSEPPGYAGRTHAAYSPAGRFVSVGDARGRLELWDAIDRRLLRVLRRDGPAVVHLSFTPDGESVAEARADGTIHFWAVPSGEAQGILSCKEQNFRSLWSLHVSPKGQRILIADGNYRARLWDRTTGEVCWRGNFGPCAFSQDGKTVVIASGPYLHFLDAANGEKRAKVRLNTDTPDGLGVIGSIACSPDGQRLAVGTRTGVVFLCDARTGAEFTHFQAVDAPKGPSLEAGLRRRFGLSVHGMSFSADGKWLATSGNDGSVRLWEVATGRQVLRQNGHLGEAAEVSFGADSRTVLSCGADAQAYLWSLRPPMGRGAKPSLDSLWTALADEPAKAYPAIWAMSETKETVAFLRGKLVPVMPGVSKERLRQLISDLESDTFAVRERATEALAKLGDEAAPAMREALANKPALETRKRLENVLQRLEKRILSPNELRIVRAIDALERQGTREARELLKTLTSGAPGALLTTEAWSALKRLRR